MNCVVQPGHPQVTVSGPAKNVEIDFAAFCGAATPRLICQGARRGAVNALAVGLHPGTDLLQSSHAGSGDRAVGHWADVQKIVAPLADNLREAVDYVAGRLP